MATLEITLLQIDPTAIGLIPLSGLRRGVRGAEATNSARLLGHLPPKHKLTIAEVALSRLSAITDPSPQKASKRCWALKPSLPHDVPLGKDLIHPSTQSGSTTRGDSEGKEAGMEGGGIHGCLATKASRVFLLRGATPEEHKTLTAAVK
ncbi:hypothetical protein Hanom_Chr05g00437081 [Helianthus anomalus]